MDFFEPQISTNFHKLFFVGKDDLIHFNLINKKNLFNPLNLCEQKKTVGGGEGHGRKKRDSLTTFPFP